MDRIKESELRAKGISFIFYITTSRVSLMVSRFSYVLKGIYFSVKVVLFNFFIILNNFVGTNLYVLVLDG